MEHPKFRVGYIDEQDAWLDTFQRNLAEEFDVVIFPLKDDTSIEQLIAAIKEAMLDCLVVDYDLREASHLTFNGDEVISLIRQFQPEFPVLIITGHEEDEVIPFVEDTDIVRSKSELAERTSLFIDRLRRKITAHKDKVKDLDTRIGILAEKKQEKTLTVSEEEELNDLYNELDRLNIDERLLPPFMYEKANMTQLSDLVREAQEILETLKNKGK